MPITIYYEYRITREMVRNNKNRIFIFGDNLLEKGYGGQAAEVRGEPNAIGIPTKKKPEMTEDSFFTDDEFEANKKAIDEAMNKIPKNATVVMSMAGLGTGRAQLKEKAPITFGYLEGKLRVLQG
jgi:hypothetical protein